MRQNILSLASAVQEIRFLFQLLEDIVGNKLFTPVTLHCDNQGALAKNPVQHQRSKHKIYHFVRSEIQKGFLTFSVHSRY